VNIENLKITPFDDRRELLIPGDQNATLDVCIRHFISACREAVEDHGQFYVALAGGSTPKALYEHISASPYKEQIPWDKIWLFWGDERSVPPEDEESNYKMALEAGLGNMPIPKSQILRMKAEESIEENALEYEKQLQKILNGRPLDLVILGMGEDGHTASLFPQTEALNAQDRLAVANFVPQKNTWRMTLTYEAINGAKNIAIYVLGAGKKHTLVEVLKSEDQFDRYPIQKIGTKERPALWIIDEAAAAELLSQKQH